MKEIIEFYNNYDEEGRLLKKNRSPEYITTMRYIKKYLTPNSRIIEIGAGTGRYSIALADMGYDVTAVELVPHNIEIMKKKVKPENNIKIYHLLTAIHMTLFYSSVQCITCSMMRTRTELSARQ